MDAKDDIDELCRRDVDIARFSSTKGPVNFRLAEPPSLLNVFSFLNSWNKLWLNLNMSWKNIFCVMSIVNLSILQDKYIQDFSQACVTEK